MFVPKKIKFEDNLVLSDLSINTHSRSEGKRKFLTKKAALVDSYLAPLKHAEEPMEIENVDLMKYWFTHRQQENAMNHLISQIREKRKCMRGVHFDD